MFMYVWISTYISVYYIVFIFIVSIICLFTICKYHVYIDIIIVVYYL